AGLLRTSNPSTSRPSISAATTQRRNGTERGTLRTRMAGLIRSVTRQYRRCHHPRKRVIQYSRDGWDRSRGCGVLDAPLKTGHDTEQEESACYATLSRNASSAAPMASGVPTCIQTPSSLRPNRRSCSLAASNIFVSENSPLGALAKIAGEKIAAPA